MRHFHRRFACAQSLALIAAAAVSTTAAARDDHVWDTYANARYGYSICYPADLLRPGAEPSAGDGVTFSGEGRTVLTVWGSYNTANFRLGDSERQDVARYRENGGEVTYRAGNAGFYVLSGRRSGHIFYLRTTLVRDKFSSFELIYPEADAPVWNDVVTHVSGCFKPG